ncbi:MAG: NAD(P)H-hydrate epimerase [Candidatus Omnitrophota bacterium]|nr:NAD(P)H-hydrate epimerase [Candidatus Omnitrophota bacterium]MBU1928823.1 NAD(P)H-hydrate epimerase [Candidatus Omnitrophota bacterium]MBU2035499.1 NAD(P)H-hydrate epimerase [Candidatus Omnitrophota bacterium]
MAGGVYTMKSVTVSQMKKLDALAIKRYGIPALILMENAGRTAAEEALKMLSKKGIRRVAVFCGYGNNGGDGLACARHLINKSIQVSIYLIGQKKKFSEESGINYQIVRKMKQKLKIIRSVSVLGKFKKEIRKCDLIIDGIFGIGIKGKLDSFYQGLFNLLNKSKIPILALDIPSGLDADTGMPLGDAVYASKTVTFGLMKNGLTKKEAQKFTGKIVIGDISLPQI